MALIAKFDSPCTRCGQMITKGSKMFWNQNKKSRHTVCYKKIAEHSKNTGENK